MWHYWVLGVLAALLLYVVYVYNSFVTLTNRIERAFSQIDVQLKRRADLLPKLINTVKGYMKHEKQTLEDITKLRTSLLDEKDPKRMAGLDDQLSGTLKSLFAVAENYPTLKANENFLVLQEEIAGTENKIAYARQFYNGQVLRLENMLEQFPTSIFGRLFNVRKQPFFKATSAEREDVDVNL